MIADTRRGGGQAPADPAERFAVMLNRLTKDALWADEYAEFVRNVSFAAKDEAIAFTAALESARRLVNV
jgi:hypothetical protein